MIPAAPLLPDRPLRHGGDDVLGFERLADALATRLEAAPAGLLVVVVAGQRGAGLTSFLALLHGGLASRGVHALRCDPGTARATAASAPAGLGPVLLVDDALPADLAGLDFGETGPCTIVACRADPGDGTVLREACALEIELPAFDESAAAVMAERLHAMAAASFDAWSDLLTCARTPRQAVRLANAGLVALAAAPRDGADAASTLAGLAATCRRGEARVASAGGSATPSATREAHDDVDLLCECAARSGDAELLSRLLDDAVPSVRHAACRALGRLEPTAGAEPLRELLGSADPQVRRAVAQALGRLGDTTSHAQLARLLVDPSKDARRAAAAALARVGGTPSLEPLLSALDDANAGVRMAAETALRSMLSRLAASPESTIGGDPDRLAESSRAELASAARDALAHALLHGTEGERVRAAEALGHVGTSSTVGLLLDAVDRGSPALRKAASASLVRLGWGQD